MPLYYTIGLYTVPVDYDIEFLRYYLELFRFSVVDRRKEIVEMETFYEK